MPIAEPSGFSPGQTTSSSFLSVFMSNGSPTAYLLWAILSSIFIIFLVLHLWAYDRFACIKWDSGRQPGAFKRVMTYSYLATLPLLVVFSVAMTALKFRAGFVVAPAGHIIPRPFALWALNDRHWLLPLYFVLAAAWSLELVTHLEELCFWLFLLHQGPAKRDWFHSWEFQTWYLGSLVAILGVPLIPLVTRRQIERVLPWLFVAGSTAGTSTTVAFLYVLARFPAFIQYVKDGGAEPDVVVRLATFYSLNQIRVLFRFLFTIPLLMLGADALSGPYPIVSNPFAVDFLLMMGGIGCFVSSAITLLIFFPRSITRESGYKARIVHPAPPPSAVANPHHAHGDGGGGGNIHQHAAQYPSKLHLGVGATPPLPDYPSYYHAQAAPYASKLSMEGEGVVDGYRDGDEPPGQGREADGDGMRLSAFRYPAQQHRHEHPHHHDLEEEDEEGDVGESDAYAERDMQRVDSPGYETDAESMIGSPTAEYSGHTMSMSMSTRVPQSPPISSMTMPDSPPPLAVLTQPNSPSQPQPYPAHPVLAVHRTSSRTAVSRPSDASGARSEDTVWERPPADTETPDILHQRQLFRRREDGEVRDTRAAGDARDKRDAPLTPSSATHYYAEAGPSTSSKALIPTHGASGSRPPSVRQKRVAAAEPPVQHVHLRQGIVVSALSKGSTGDGQRSGKAGVMGTSRSRTPSVLALSSEEGGQALTASSTGVGGIRMPVLQRTGTPRMSDRGTQEHGSRRDSARSTLHPYLMNFTSPIDLYDDTPEPIRPPYA